MAEYNIKYKTGDEIYISGKVERAEVINGKVFYKIKECEEIIPQEIVYPKTTKASIDIVMEDCHEIKGLEDELIKLNELYEKARSILEELACKEVKVAVKPVVSQ